MTTPAGMTMEQQLLKRAAHVVGCQDGKCWPTCDYAFFKGAADELARRSLTPGATKCFECDKPLVTLCLACNPLQTAPTPPASGAMTAENIGGAIYEETCQIAQDDEARGTLTTHAERYRRLGQAAIRASGAMREAVLEECIHKIEIDRDRLSSGAHHAWIGGMDYAISSVRTLAQSTPAPSADGHDSDCATHNAPAYPNGPCDCSRRDNPVREGARYRVEPGRLGSWQILDYAPKKMHVSGWTTKADAEKVAAELNAALPLSSAAGKKKGD